MDTTIKVDSRVRDRLALLAAERGVSIRELVAGLTGSTPTCDELEARAAAAAAAIRQRLAPGLTTADLEAAEGVWSRLESGDTPRGLAAQGDGSDGHPPARSA